MHNNSPIGLEPGGPISPHEHVELDFLRYENAHLQTRLRDLEKQVNQVTIERDTIQHERNLAIQDLRWTRKRVASAPRGLAGKRMGGGQKLLSKWAN